MSKFFQIANLIYIEIDSPAEKLLLSYSKEYLDASMKAREDLGLMKKIGDEILYFASRKSMEKFLKV